jgi:hypothetical protein
VGDVFWHFGCSSSYGQTKTLRMKKILAIIKCLFFPFIMLQATGTQNPIATPPLKSDVKLVAKLPEQLKILTRYQKYN